MRNEIFRKSLVCAIFLLFVGISLMPIAGSLSIERVSTASQIQKSNLGDDTTPPVTTCTLNPPEPNGENGWYVSDVEVTLNATDDMSGVKVTYYSINRGPWNIYTDPLTIDTEGATIVDYFSIDNACNPEMPKNEWIKIDEMSPWVDLNAERIGNIILELKVKVTATCYDETSGMSYVEFFMNEEYKFTDDTAPYEWDFDWPDGVGSATFTGKAYDMAGNIAEDNIYVESLNQVLSNHQGQINNQQTLPASTGLLDDTTPPVTTISFDPPYPDGENGWYVSNVTVTLNATDDMSGVDFIKYLLDDSDWLTYTSPLIVESDGCHRITYYAVDKAGNVEQPSEVIRFGIDQTPPTIDLTWEAYKEDDGWYILFTATCNDATSGVDRVEFYINDVLAFIDDMEPYEWLIYYDGWTWTYKATAFDNAGNSAFVTVKDSDIHSYSSQSAEIVEKSSMYVSDLERTIVSETFLDPPCYLVLNGTMGENGWYVSCVMISFVYDPEEIVAVYYNVDSGSWQIYTAPYEVCWDGEHIICWYYIDKEGNQSAIECIELKIDRIPPTIDLTWESYNNGILEIFFLAFCNDATSGMDYVEFFIEDVYQFTDYAEPYEWSIEWSTALEGCVFYAYAYDKAGNMNEDAIGSPYIESSIIGLIGNPEFSRRNVGPSLLPSIGTEIVENKNVENNVRNTFLRGAVLEVTTDKDVYDPSETVTIYLTNIGDEILYGGGPLITIYNEDDEIVFEEATYCWHELEPEEYITWTWDQTDQQGSQVPTGFYVVEGSLFGVGETFVDSSIFAVTEEDLVVHIDWIEGENDWYISCVTITVLYDPEVIKEVYVNGEIYLEPVVICEDGEHDVEITAVDWDGNWMSPMSICFWIDKTPPWIDLTWEASGNNIIGWKVKWTATCSDAMSGMDGVYFRINNVVQFTDYEAPYEWVIEWSSVLEGVMFSATAFDNAGNSAWEWACPPEIQLHSNSQSSQQFSNPLFFQILERLLNTR